jgi:PAS domain S-box-containing protein
MRINSINSEAARVIFDRLAIPTLFIVKDAADLAGPTAPIAYIREPFHDNVLADAMHSLVHVMEWERERRRATQELPEYQKEQRAVSDSPPDNRIAETLKEREEQLQTMFEAFPDAVILADPETGLIKDVNEQARKMLGRSKEELIGLHQGDLHPEWLRQEAQDIFARHVDEIQHMTFGRVIESYIQRSDGYEIPVEISPCMVNVNNRPLIMGIFRDVSESHKAKKAFQESEERYRLLVENLNHVIFSLDAEGRFTYISPVLEGITGKTPDEVVGRPFEEFVHPDDVPALYEAIEAQLRGETPRVEYRAIRKDGSWVWASASSRPVYEDGRLIGFTGVWIDVTERREAEEALRISEERYRHLVENAPTGIYEIDFEQNRIVTVNEAAAEHMGMSREEMMSMPATDLLDEEGQRLFAERLTQRAAGLPVPNTVEYHVKGHRGKEYWGQFSIKDIEKDGRIKGAQVVAHDVTQLKQANMALRVSEEKYRSLVNALSEGIVQYDAEGAVTFCNKAAEEILGLTREQFMKFTPTDPGWQFISEDGVQLTEEHRLSRLSLQRRQAMRNMVLGIKKPDGALAWISVNTQPIYLEQEEPSGVVVSFVDVTTNKEAEAAIKKALREKEILLREIHHRVKNNMQVITSLLNLQAGQVDDPNTLEVLLESQNRVAAMALVHEALYESDSLAEIDLEKYLSGLIRMLIVSHTGSGCAPKVNLDIACGIVVGLDHAIPCGLILNELISNSMKHAFPNGQSGTIKIRVAEEGPDLTVVVKDNGVGMPADKEWRNTGTLGMTLVTSLTEIQLDGEIQMERVNGTKFTVRFPTSK